MNDDDLYKEYSQLNQFKINTAFTEACGNGELDKVRFLLTSNRLSFHADIHYFNDMGFVSACLYRKFNIVKYLLTSSELKENANINAQDDFAIRGLCNYSDVDIIKYLLTSSELKTHSNIHAQYDDAFKNAYIAQHFNVLQYLILDFKIERTEEINQFMIENPNKEIEEMFKKRELKESLEKGLDYNTAIIKKNKL
jgi:hypothetical protein